MAVTKTLIETYAGDTIQYTVPVTLTVDGDTVTDMTGWSFRFQVNTPTATEATVNDDDIATASFSFVITDELTGGWTPGTYMGYGKLQSPAEDEFTVIEATLVVSAEGID